MWKLWCAIATVAAVFLQPSVGHTYHTGQCPSVEPMSGFEMKRFLGIWYVIQKTSTASSCIVYNITRGEEPGDYNIEQLSQHFALGLTPLKHEYSYTGKLSVNDPDVAAKMTVKFPLSVAGTASFTVFMTDYEDYAAIFSCQRLTFAHRRSATIMSRTRTLDKAYLDKIRNRLSSYSVNPFDLSIINQTGCPKVDSTDESGFNIHIDPDTFSGANVASVVRKAGEKIGDGIEYAVDAGKKVFNKLTNSSKEQDNSSGNSDSENIRTATAGVLHSGRSNSEPLSGETEWLYRF